MKNAFKQILICLLFTVAFHEVYSQSILWSNSIKDPTNNIIPWKAATDKEGNLYVIGTFLGTIQGISDIICYGGTTLGDAFLAKFDSQGNLKWINRIGSTNEDEANAICITPDDKSIYIAGDFNTDPLYFSNSYPASGSDFISSDGGWDSYLAKYDSSGTLVSKQKIAGGLNNQRVYSLKIDMYNCLYLAGYYVGSVTFPDNSTLSGSNSPSFILKMNNNGNIIWKKNITSSVNAPNPKIRSIELCNQYVYLTGVFRQDITYNTSTPLSTGGSTNDAFLFKIDTSSNYIFGRRIYGSGDDLSISVSVDSLCNAYLSGYYSSSTLNIDSSASRLWTMTGINNGSYDIMYAKYRSNGDLSWFKHYGGSNYDAINRSSNGGGIFAVSGYFKGSINIDTVSLASNGSGYYDMLNIVYNNNDNLVYAFKIGATNDDQGYATTIDKFGNYYFIGGFKSTSLTVGSSTYTNTDGFSDMLVTKYAKGDLLKTSTNVLCKGKSTGSIIVSPRGPLTAPYRYYWTKDGDAGFSSRNDSLFNLSAGTYRVTFIDTVGYTITDYVTITEPSTNTSIVVDSLKHVMCRYGNTGKIYIKVTGGTSPYKYNWVTSNGSGANNEEDQDSLTAGTYSVFVTDNNNCVDSLKDSIITQPATAVSFSSVVVNPINGVIPTGAVDITIIGGTPFSVGNSYNYAWSGPSGYSASTEDISSLGTQGNYSVITTDSKGCNIDTTVLVADTTKLYVNVEYKVNVSCFGGSDGIIEVEARNAKGALTYSWAPGGMTADSIFGLSAGTYTVTITDAGRLPGDNTATANITITQPSAALAVSKTAVDAKCFGINNGSINLTVTGGTAPYTFSWLRNSTPFSTSEDLSGLSPAQYDYTVRDAKLCPATGTYTIPSPTQITVNDLTNIIVPQTCYGGTNDGSITLVNISGGTPYYNNKYYYTWSNGTQGMNLKSATSLAPGNWGVTIRDTFNCTITKTYNVSAGPVINGTKTQSNVNCYGASTGAACINPSFQSGRSLGSFLWNDPTNSTNDTAFNLAAGNYTVVVKDNLNCEQPFSFTISQPSAPLTLGTPSVGNVSPCFGDNNGSITIAAAGGNSSPNYTYVLRNGASTVTSNTSGIFTNLIPSTNYRVEVTDGKSCGPVISSPITITQPNPVVANLSVSPNDTICSGTSVTFTATPSGRNDYIFKINSSSFPRGTSNTYTPPAILNGSIVEVTVDSSGCTNTSSAIVMKVYDLPTAILSGSSTICRGQSTNLSVALTGKKPWNITYSDGTTPVTINNIQTTPYTISVTPLSNRTYSITAMNDSNCTGTGSGSAVINVNALPTASMSGNANICDGQNTTITINLTGQAPWNINYTDGSVTNNIITNSAIHTFNVSPSDTTTYSVTSVSDGNSCTGTSFGTSATINVRPLPTSTVSGSATICAGQSTPLSIDLTGTSPWNITYNAGSTPVNIVANTDPYNFNVNPLSNTTYTVTAITDGNSCVGTSFSGSAAITVNQLPSVTGDPLNDTTCVSQNASFTVAATGAGLTYQWQLSTNNGSTWANQGNAGVYSGMTTASMTITGATLVMNGYMYRCIVGGSCNPADTSNSAVLRVVSPISITTQPVNITVCRFLPASFYLKTNGSGNTYQWQVSTNSGATWANITNGAVYTGTTADSMVIYSSSLTQNGYRYRCLVNNSCNSPVTSNSVILTVNSYPTVTMTCSDADRTICSNTPVSFTATAGLVNYDFRVNNVSVQNGTSNIYTSSTMTNNFNIIVDGTQNNCTASSTVVSVTVNSSTPVTLTSNDADNTICSGSSIGFTATSGLSNYNFRVNGATVQNSASNTFTTTSLVNNDIVTVVGTNTNNCNSTSSGITVNVNPNPLVTASVIKQESCAGSTDGQVKAVASAGTAPYTYTWNTTPVQINDTAFNITGGTYTVSVVDSRNCGPVTANVTLAQVTPVSLTESVSAHKNLTCNKDNSGSITVVANGGSGTYEYAMNSLSTWVSAATFNNLAAGRYKFLVRDANATTCVYNGLDSISVTEPSAITANVIQKDISCHGLADGSAVVQASGGTGGYQYLWNDSKSTTNDTVSALGPGSVNVIVTDQNTCNNNFSTIISEPDSFVTSITKAKNVNCFGDSSGSIEISATGGRLPYSFSWSNGELTQNIDSLKSGSYTLNAADFSNCTSTQNVAITEATQISASVKTDSVRCYGMNSGRAIATATGGIGILTYTWNDSQITINDTLSSIPAGAYTCIVKDDSGCTRSFNTNVYQLDSLYLSEDINSHLDALCNGSATGAFKVLAQGGSGQYDFSLDNINWTKDNQYFSMFAGTYKFYLRDSKYPECVYTKAKSILVLEPLALNISEPFIVNTTDWNSNDGSIQINAQGGPGGYTFTIYPGEISNSTGTFTVSTGNYMITVTDFRGCDTISSEITYVGPYPVGIGTKEQSSPLAIFPNPTEGILTIQYFDPSASRVKIEIYNVQGAIVYSKEFSNKQNNFFIEKINLSDKPKGIYIVKINDSVFKDRIILK